MAKCEHSKRLLCIDKEVIGPREEAVSARSCKSLLVLCYFLPRVRKAYYPKKMNHLVYEPNFSGMLVKQEWLVNALCVKCCCMLYWSIL